MPLEKLHVFAKLGDKTLAKWFSSKHSKIGSHTSHSLMNPYCLACVPCSKDGLCALFTHNGDDPYNQCTKLYTNLWIDGLMTISMVTNVINGKFHQQ
jgi:hypothetical protein